MKSRIIIILSLVILGTYVQAYDFKATNEQGVELAFNVLSEGNSVEFTYDVQSSWSDDLNGFAPVYTYLTCDTLYIPSVVNHDGKEYIVTQIGSYAFMGMVPKVRVVIIPATITSIVYDRGGVAFQGNNLQSIIVDSANLYFKSEKGILYTSDMKSLIAYPARNPQDTIVLREGIQTLEKASLLGAQNIKYLELPLSLKTIQKNALSVIDTLHSLIIKDSVERIESNVLDCRGLVHLTIGSGVQLVNKSFLYSDSVVNLSCRAVVPPQISQHGGVGEFLQEVIERDSRLYVPAKSIAAYQLAEGWSDFKYIYPIEPPIVAGVDEATVSWVQNFSATGYVWTLYSDEAHTQMVMTLTFDQRGYLTSIVLGNAASAPQRALAQAVADDEGSGNSGSDGNGGDDNGAGSDSDSEKRFAEYYSFTISSLNRNTQYYYTRQSLSDDQVIDEESGTFVTSDKTATDIDAAPATDDTSSAAIKIISNGQVYILRDGKVYTTQGLETREQ